MNRRARRLVVLLGIETCPPAIIERERELLAQALDWVEVLALEPDVSVQRPNP